MPKETQSINLKLAPHLTSDVGIKRFNEANRIIGMADYECFIILRELSENGMLSKGQLLYSLGRDIGNGTTQDEAVDCAGYWADEVERALEMRRNADLLLTNAMRGT